MARYLVIGCASIYLWKNVRKNLSEDNCNVPINVLSSLRNFMSRLRSRTNLFDPNFFLDDIQFILGRIINCVPNCLMKLNNGLKFEERFEDYHKQPPISINKTFSQLNNDQIEPINPTTHFDDIKGFDNAKNDLISYMSTFKIGPSSCLDQKSLTKGCVLYGPPKFERTILMHALAGEMKMGLFEISSLSLDGSFYCNGKKIEDVNEIVEQASKFSPVFLIFFLIPGPLRSVLLSKNCAGPRPVLVSRVYESENRLVRVNRAKKVDMSNFATKLFILATSIKLINGP